MEKWFKLSSQLLAVNFGGKNIMLKKYWSAKRGGGEMISIGTKYKKINLRLNKEAFIFLACDPYNQ